MDTTKAQFEAIRQLIRDKQYPQARAWLRTLDTPLAADWLKKLDRIAPEPPSKPAAVVSPSNPRQGIPVIAFAAFALIAVVFVIGAFLVGRSSAPQTQTVVIVAPTQPTPDMTQTMIALQMTLGADNQIRRSTIAAIETINKDIADKLTETSMVATRVPRNTSTPRPTLTPSLTFTPLPPLPAKLSSGQYGDLARSCAQSGTYLSIAISGYLRDSDFLKAGIAVYLRIAERCAADQGFQIAWFIYSSENESVFQLNMDKDKAWADFLIGWDLGVAGSRDMTATVAAYYTARPTEIEATPKR